MLLALLLETLQFKTLFPLDRYLDQSVAVTLQNQMLIFFRSFKTNFYYLLSVLSYVYLHMLFPLQKMLSSTNIEVFTSFSLPLSSLPKKLQHKQQVLHWLFFTQFLLAVVTAGRCEHKTV
jgi:hypothetical protein